AAQYQHKIAIVFGREDRGLTNEELALANYHLTIPVNSEYGVLNVAAAIQLVCYELRMHALAQQTLTSEKIEPHKTAAAQMPLTTNLSMDWDEPLVTHAQMQQFYPHMESMLADIDFIDPKNPRLL
ncbi:TrmH family RNA methyltransferase, partial [Rhizobium hidalgonense]